MNLNRLANVSNQYQTKAKRVLAVCSAGLLRSPSVANVLHAKYGYNTRAAGCSDEYALIPVDLCLIAWADEVVCVENEVHNILNFKFKNEKIWEARDKVILSLPDRFEWMDPELVKLIEKQYDDNRMIRKFVKLQETDGA